MLHEDNITHLTIDWQKKTKASTVREIQYSTISKEGVLASYDIYHQEKEGCPPQISTAFQTLQVYRAEHLCTVLEACGFDVIQQGGLDHVPFHSDTTERIYTVAKKR